MARLETRGRNRALQALYAWDMRGQEGLERVALQTWDDLAVGPEERRVAGALVRTMLKRGPEIDALLTEVTTNWRLERLGAIERSVLRLASAELLDQDTPAKVVILEAVRLAERYASAPSARFVNGVMDAVARKLGKL